jgi:branched-subunit amino acid aminotransferase/4-amino-4-deoxychorismate lyase
MAGKLRKIVEEQNSYISRINKSLELLRIYHDYKLFLDSLAPPKFKEALERRKEKVRAKIERKERMAQAARDKKGGNAAAQAAAAAAAAAQRHDDNDVVIPKDLRDLIEDSDDDYKPCFEHPD